MIIITSKDITTKICHNFAFRSIFKSSNEDDIPPIIGAKENAIEVHSIKVFE